MSSDKENEKSVLSFQGIDVFIGEYDNIVYIDCSLVGRSWKPSFSTWIKGDAVNRYCRAKGLRKNKVIKACTWLCEELAIAYAEEIGPGFCSWLKAAIGEFKNKEVLPIKSNEMKVHDSVLAGLVFNDESGHILTNSLLVAEKFGKQHKDVLEAVRQILAAENSATKFFVEASYVNRGKDYPLYVMNRDGFSLLVKGFTGEKALQFKLDFIAAFNEMEQKLKEEQPKQLSSAEMFLQIAQINVQQEKKIAELECKVTRIEERTKTNLEYSTVVAYCTRNNIPIDVQRLGALGRKASSICKKAGIEVSKISDPRWGYVNCYPDRVLREVFGKIQLAEN